MTEITKERRDESSMRAKTPLDRAGLAAMRAELEFRIIEPEQLDALFALALDALDAAEAKMGEPVGECRYCGNSGWFYGDPALDTFCGCAFGELREELSAVPPVAEPVIPEGWVLVPAEPTEAMIEAGSTSRPYMEEGGRDEWVDRNTEGTWSAMLAAAPALTASPEPSHE